MSSHGTTPLLHRRFRSNDAYEFVPFRRLAEAERALFADLTNQADNVGILRPPRGSALGVKNATRSIAALTRLLRRPAQLPQRVRSVDTGQVSRDLASLVLDGILEVEHEGSFVTGVAAGELLLDRALPSFDNDPVAQVSVRALRYANSLEIADASVLAARLYFYNRQPTTPVWAHRLASTAAVERFLGLSDDSALSRTVARFWNRVPPKDLPGWINLMRRFRLEGRNPLLPTYKLYISPALESVPEVLHATVPVLLDNGAPDFKIGGDLFGLLRPDKMVVYFDSLAALREVAAALEPVIGSSGSHGVPFTAGLGEGTMMSWGMDPPRALKLLKWKETESWRLWVSNRLASYIVAARAAPASRPLEPWHYALVRLRFEGVDIATFTPSAAIWSVENGTAHGDH